MMQWLYPRHCSECMQRQSTSATRGKETHIPRGKQLRSPGPYREYYIVKLSFVCCRYGVDLFDMSGLSTV